MYPMHPITEDYDDFTEFEYQQLKKSLREHGLKVAIAIWHGEIVDGRHRARACEEIGVAPRYQDLTAICLTEADMRTHVVALNQHRRSRTMPLTNEEKRARIEAALAADPARSDRAIAEETGVKDQTVTAHRNRLAESGGAQFVQPADRKSRSGKRGEGQRREIVRSPNRGSAPSDQRAEWRVGLDPDEQRAIVAAIKSPDHRAVLDDVPADIRKIVAANLAKLTARVEARTREEARGNKYKKVFVFNPRWYASSLDSATCNMLVVKHAERRWDILAAAAKEKRDSLRRNVVADLITPVKVKTIREKYPELFDKEPRSYLDRYLGSIDDTETRALRDFAGMLVNDYRSRGTETTRAMLHKFVACLRECTDARSWSERLWALGDGLVAEEKKDAS